MQIKLIDGGVVAPEGFFASGIATGIKPNNVNDFALVCSDDTAAAAGVFCERNIRSNSVKVAMEHIANGYANAIVVSSGNANACNGQQGIADAREICRLTAENLSCDPEDIIFLSTGIMGKPLPMDALASAVENLVGNMSEDGNLNAIDAIMTCDTRRKEYAAEFKIHQDEVVRIGVMVKGSGIYYPLMGGITAIITTDVNISKVLLQKALETVVSKTFSKICVDGRLCGCEAAVALANGQADNTGIVTADSAYDSFVNVLNYLCSNLCKDIVRDCNSSRYAEIIVKDAASQEQASAVALALASSSAFKDDISEGYCDISSIISALNGASVDFTDSMLDVFIGDIQVLRGGSVADFDEDAVKDVLSGNEVTITVTLTSGTFSERLLTSLY